MVNIFKIWFCKLKLKEINTFTALKLIGFFFKIVHCSNNRDDEDIAK